MRKKIFILFIFITFFSIGFFILPNTSRALDTGLNYVDNTIGLGNEDPRIIAARVIQIFLGLLGLIALVIILYAGFLWMTSGGSDDKVGKAKKTLTNAVIGLLIILASFGIVTFILNSFLDATGVGNNNSGGGGANVNLGLGALGACSVESVYPTPGQKDVPRNTSILISFKEPVLAEDMCGDSNNNGICEGGEYINTNNIEIFKTEEMVNIADIQILDTNGDNMDFILTPDNLLGSSAEKFWYTVKLKNDISKKSEDGFIFDSCSPEFMQWDFQIGTILDLVPPKVKLGGVFPGPDNVKDTTSSTTAMLATGSITVNSCNTLKTYQPASIASTTSVGGTLVDISSSDISPNYHQQIETFYVQAVSPVKAQLFEGVGTSTLITIANINSDSVNFPNYFSLNFDDTPEDGNLWQVNISPEVFADTLRVGDIVYSFSDSSGATKIKKGANNNEQAQFISGALNNNPAVLPSVSTTTPNVINLDAYSMGAVGNDIMINTSNETALSIEPMSGGLNAQITYNANDKKDKPRNSIIQINFNEAINPALVSGNADEVKDTVRVINVEGTESGGAACSEDKDCLSYKCDSTTLKCSGNQLAGKFVLSNLYSTLEFVSDNICGVNGCGETIYCLPGDSHLQVEIEAAALDDCNNDADCSTLDPYLTCSTYCQNSSSDNYPTAKKPVSAGVVDLAFNSFDGNRDGKVHGPISYYSENDYNSAGKDNYKWSFYISDYIALDPPKIKSIEPDVNVIKVALNTPIKIEFDGLMMKSSLKTGSTVIRSGNENFTHRRVNLWGSASYPLGYWLNSEDIDLDQPLDGLDETHLYINHSLFADSMSHKAEAGSGVKNIYQNCFKPSASNICNATSGSPSCCNNVATSTSFCP